MNGDLKIPAEERYPKQRARVLGSTMAYVETGAGDPIVFLHGNPTSSYLWRNVIPQIEGLGRCIAPDLNGMGDSDKLSPSGPDRYTFIEHRRYLDALLDGLGVRERVTLVIHDWGSALGFDWANRHRDAVRGIAYMEAIVRPVTWAEWPDNARKIFQGLRSPAGDEMILQKNVFVERILPASVLRGLTEAEMTVYRRPYLRAGEDRRPLLSWPRQIPVEGEPPEVVAIVEAYAKWLSESPVPKLFVNAEPGSILVGPQREFCRAWPAQTEVTVRGSHFIQEDSPDEIGRAIAAWMGTLG
jgi:haloalkane dehalogenase